MAPNAHNRQQAGLFDRVRAGLANIIKPKAYQGAFESTRYSVHRTRIDAPQPADFKHEMSGATRREMVRLSRWLEKNNGLYKQMIKDNAIYSIGDGIHLQALGGDYQWQQTVEAEWEQDSRTPEVTGRFSLLECLYIICEALDRDGEIFVIKTKINGEPKFQIIEAHKVETPPTALSSSDVFDGIRFGTLGEPKSYFIRRMGDKYEEVDAVNVMHIFDAEYASQARAYPPHQHAISNLRDEMDLLAMEKVAAKDNARTSRVLKVEDPKMDAADVGLGQPIGENAAQTSNTDPESLSRILGGVTAVLQNNESLASYVPARPSSAFAGFIEHLRRDSMLGGGAGYEFTADPSDAGGAGVRLVVAKAGRFFSHRQQIIINRFLVEYFKYWAGVKIANKVFPNAKNWWRSDWVPPKSVNVDAGREGQNERADLDMGRVPPSDDMQARGYQFEKTIRQTARDFAFIKKVSEETGIPIDQLWRKSPMPGAGGPQNGQGEQKPIPQGALGVVMPGPDGRPQIVPIEKIDPNGQAEDSPEGESVLFEPKLTEPKVDKGYAPIPEGESSQEVLPLQNQGLSRSKDQPYAR